MPSSSVWGGAPADPQPIVSEHTETIWPGWSKEGKWVAAGDPITHYVWEPAIPGGRPGGTAPPAIPAGARNRYDGYPVIVGGVYHATFRAYQVVTGDDGITRLFDWKKNEEGRREAVWRDPVAQATFDWMGSDDYEWGDPRPASVTDLEPKPLEEGWWKPIYPPGTSLIGLMPIVVAGMVTHYVWKPHDAGVRPSRGPVNMTKRNLPFVVDGTWYESWDQFLGLGLAPGGGGGGINIGGISISPVVLAGGAIAVWLLLRK